MLFGCAVQGVVGAYLVELAEPVGASRDRWVWVVVGIGPSAYLVPDLVKAPRDALRVHADLLDDWLADAARGGEGKGVFPFTWSRTGEAVQRLRAFETEVRHYSTASVEELRVDPRWIDARRCPTRRLPDKGVVGQVEPSASKVGKLVRDHMGHLGIIVDHIPCPDSAWLALQRDPRFRLLTSDEWVKILCVSGGSVAVPMSLTQVEGEPSPEHIQESMRNANEFGKRELRRVWNVD